MLLLKTRLVTIEVLIPKALVDSYTNHDEFASVNNVSREYNEMKLLWNILDKRNENVLHQLQEKCCEQKFKSQEN